jgi:hypothetical protein
MVAFQQELPGKRRRPMSTSQVLAERAEIEQRIAGQTLCDYLRTAAELWGGEPAL